MQKSRARSGLSRRAASMRWSWQYRSPRTLRRVTLSCGSLLLCCWQWGRATLARPKAKRGKAMAVSGLDTVLSGGKAVLADGAVGELDIGVAGGRIAALAAPGSLTGRVAVDIKGLVVMPGVVDAHVHLGH